MFPYAVAQLEILVEHGLEVQGDGLQKVRLTHDDQNKAGPQRTFK